LIETGAKVKDPLFEVLDFAPFGVHRYELLADGRLVFIGANTTANVLLGVDHAQFVGKTIEEAFPALTETEVPSRYREVASTRQPWQMDQIAYDEQGITGAFDVRAVPMGPSQMAVYFTDITARLRTERDLRTTQAELNGYFDNALDLLCIATREGRFKRLNPEWERTLGYPLDELVGQPFTALVHPDDLPATLTAIAELSEQRNVKNFVNRYRCKDGSYRSIEWRSFAAANEIYAIARDVTDRVEAAQKLQQAYRELTVKTKEMEDLLYVTTHDLRSPLVNIQGFSARVERSVNELESLVANRDSPTIPADSLRAILGRVRSSLGYIVGSAQKMDRLINGLLQLSRLGRRPLQCTVLDMENLWSRIQTLFRHQLNEACVTIETGSLPACYGDPSQLEQVYCNLLDNAIKYRDAERRCVVRLEGEKAEDGAVVYRFSDTGLGINPLYVDRIWELFHRLAPQNGVPGEGIGLTAVRQIVARHGGMVEVESTPAVGTKFTLRMPSEPKAKAPPQSRSEDGK